jgi:hypothetical protein
MAKKTENTTPEEIMDQATPEAEAPTEGKNEAPKAAKKVYKFVSDNKFLTCTALGVQFMNGKAETDSLEVAKALVKISGVTMIEE